MKLVRKISIGEDYKDAMHYSLGQKVWGNHEIVDIKDKLDGGYIIYIQKDGDTMPWKEFNGNVAISIEYDLEY